MTINFASTLWQWLGCRGAVSQGMYCWNCWKKEIIVAAIWLSSVGRNPMVERVNGSMQKQQKQLSKVNSFQLQKTKWQIRIKFLQQTNVKLYYCLHLSCKLATNMIACNSSIMFLKRIFVKGTMLYLTVKKKESMVILSYFCLVASKRTYVRNY